MSVLRTSSRLLRSQIRRVQSVPVALYHENVSVSQHVLSALSTHIDLTESSFVISFIDYIHTHTCSHGHDECIYLHCRECS